MTAYAAQRGIMVYATGNSVFYLNRHTGNTDDLAHAYSNVSDLSASARSNLVAFAASGGENFHDPPGPFGTGRVRQIPAAIAHVRARTRR